VISRRVRRSGPVILPAAQLSKTERAGVVGRQREYSFCQAALNGSTEKKFSSFDPQSVDYIDIVHDGVKSGIFICVSRMKMSVQLPSENVSEWFPWNTED